MEFPRSKNFLRKIPKNYIAGAALAVIGGTGFGIGAQIETTNKKACIALIETLGSMEADDAQRQQLCSNELIRSCLEDSHICRTE